MIVDDCGQKNGGLFVLVVSRTLVVGSSTSISPVLIAIPPFRSIQRRDKPEMPHRSNVCFRAEERVRLHRAREPPPWRKLVSVEWSMVSDSPQLNLVLSRSSAAVFLNPSDLHKDDVDWTMLSTSHLSSKIHRT